MKATLTPITYATKTRPEILDCKEFKIIEESDKIYGKIVTKINKGMQVKIGYGFFYGNGDKNKKFLKTYFSDDDIRQWIFVTEDWRSFILPGNFAKDISVNEK